MINDWAMTPASSGEVRGGLPGTARSLNYPVDKVLLIEVGSQDGRSGLMRASLESVPAISWRLTSGPRCYVHV